MRPAADFELIRLSATELLSGYRTRAFSPLEVIDALARQIEAVDPLIQAFAATSLERARAEAARLSRAYQEGDAVGVLAGVPVAVKDILDTAGLETTYGSAMFSSHVPSEDAVAVESLRSSGAIVIGKTRLHEFGWGITSYNAVLPSCRNPWDTSRSPGGSSGGSAAALAAFETPLALGTDTGGSIRIPAAFCGVAGFKPTYGLVSTRGAWPLAPSLDHVGPMARTVEDLQLVLAALVPLRAPRAHENARIGVWKGPLDALLNADVAAVLSATAQTLEEIGACVTEIQLPEARNVADVFATVQRAEAINVHVEAGLWPERSGGYGADVAMRLRSAEQQELVATALAALARDRLSRACDLWFAGIDFILSPVSACGPPVFGADSALVEGVERDVRTQVIPHTALQNLIGIPSCAFRAGFDRAGLPVGLQLSGPRGADTDVLWWARRLAEATPELHQVWPESVRTSAMRAEETTRHD